MGELITVIVPVYQAQKYLKRCIDSILSQTYHKLEILLVDDGSTDDSLDICRKYALKDERIQVISKKNGGVSSARNAGLSAMTGDYLMMVDADDYIEPDMAGVLLEAAKKEQAQVVIGGLDFVFESGEDVQTRCPSKYFSGTKEALFQEMFLELYDKQLLNNQNNKLYDAGLVRRNQICYDEKMCINEDIWFCMRMITLASRIACVPHIYFHYWQHSKAESLITRFWPNGVDTCFTLLKAVRQCLDMGNASPELRNDMYNRMVYHIGGFVGLCYYRSDYSNRQCYQEVRRLWQRQEWRALAGETRPRGIKNRAAVLLLGHGWCRIYHFLCLLVYRRQRRKRRNENRQSCHTASIKDIA